jgi:PIN domain nuclease of toxin-antitoxin system
VSLLLDTQALLWFLLDDSRLSSTAREAIADHPEPVRVSPASHWQIAIKISLGKYELPMAFRAFWEGQLAENDFTILPIALAHTAKVAELPFHHRDPFDRLLIAQALQEDIPIVGNDVAFDAYGVKRIW